MASTLDPDALRIAISEVLRTDCAVLAIAGLRERVGELGTAAAIPGDAGVHWTPGAALLADGVPRAGDLQGTSRADYHRFNDSVVLARKRDTITSAGILDRNHRAGGWGAIAGDVSRQLGGTRTARSIRTLAGTHRHARVHLPNRPLTDCGLGLVLRPFLALYGGTAHLHRPVSAPPQYCDGRRRHVQCHPADPHVRRFRRHRCQVRPTAGPPWHQPNETRVDAEPVGSGCASRHLPPEGCLRFRMDRKSRSTSSSSFPHCDRTTWRNYSLS